MNGKRSAEAWQNTDMEKKNKYECMVEVTKHTTDLKVCVRFAVSSILKYIAFKNRENKHTINPREVFDGNLSWVNVLANLKKTEKQKI